MQIEPREVGRPTVITDEALRKLEEIFALGGSDKEACFYAGIGTTALYNYQQANPLFVERKAALKELPVLKARRTVEASLSNPEHAKWYLERKAKGEFAQRTENINVELPTPLFNLNELRKDDSPQENQQTLKEN